MLVTISSGELILTGGQTIRPLRVAVEESSPRPLPTPVKDANSKALSRDKSDSMKRVMSDGWSELLNTMAHVMVEGKDESWDVD